MAKLKPAKRTTTKKVQDTENLPPSLPDVRPAPEDDTEEDFDSDGLTIRRREFVEAITGIAMGNATKAARIAGYASDNELSLRSTGSRLLTFVEVSRAIARRLAEKRIDAESVKLDIATLSHSSMDNFAKVVDGKFVVDWNAAAAAGAIGQIREVEIAEGEDGVEFVRKFRLYDRLRAAEIIAKMNGQLAEHHEVNIKGSVTHEHRMQAAMGKLLSNPEAFEKACDLSARMKDPPKSQNGNGNGSGNNHG